jgi:deoxyadenosine/deoxycytidine kinase
MPKPDLYIYLYQNSDVCCKTSRKEAGSYSKNPAEYLDKINSGYLDYIKSQTELNVLIIDVSDRSFVKKQDYLYVLDEIKRKFLNDLIF